MLVQCTRRVERTGQVVLSRWGRTFRRVTWRTYIKAGQRAFCLKATTFLLEHLLDPCLLATKTVNHLRPVHNHINNNPNHQPLTSQH